MNKRILWKALDGREFIIDTNELGLKSMEEVYDYVAELREKYNTGKPDVMLAAGDVPKDASTVESEQLPEHLRSELDKSFKEALAKPDPKKMN